MSRETLTSARRLLVLLGGGGKDGLWLVGVGGGEMAETRGKTRFVSQPGLLRQKRQVVFRRSNCELGFRIAARPALGRGTVLRTDHLHS